MKRTLIKPELSAFPECFHPLLSGCDVFDSSCSPEARVWYIEKDRGLFLKAAPLGTLKQEAEMTRYFYSKALSPEVLRYEAFDRDWLLTRRMPGEDCTHAQYLADPRRLSAMLGEQLRQLHELDTKGCLVTDRTQQYLDTARKNYSLGRFDPSSFPAAAEEVWRFVEEHAALLDTTTLIHGDYCLPNIMLDNWAFSGFIDLGFGGLADRHIDLYWGAWSLGYNLGTDAFRDRFLDAYGRDKINEDLLRVIGAIEAFG